MTIHLHHLQNSRSWRIVWLLEELGLTYQLTHYQRRQGLAPQSLKQVHPMGKSPILQDGDKTLMESAHIIEYLIDHYDNPQSLTTDKQFRPDYGTDDYQQYRYWLHFVEGSLMNLLVMRLMFATVVKKSPFIISTIAKQMQKAVEKSYLTPSLTAELDMLNQHLAHHHWLVGEQFTAADIQLHFAIAAMEKSAILTKYPHILRWYQQCQARPAYQKALQKGGTINF